MDIKRLFLLCLFVANASAFGAQKYYSSVTFDHTKVPSSQSDFPALLSFTDNRFKTVANGGHVNNSNGYDIRPYSDSGLTSTVSYELERYNATTGEVVMWVKVASISGTVLDTVIFLGYGDPSISTDGSSGSSTFSNSFISVYHVKDGTTLSVADATNTHNGTNVGTVTATSGQIDGAASFVSGSNQYIDCGSYTGPTAITLSAWVNATSFPNSYDAVIGRNNAGGTVQAIILGKSTGKLAMYVAATTGRSYDPGSHTLSTGTWYHVALTYDSTNGLVGYVNAASDGTATANGTLQIGSLAMRMGSDPGVAGRDWNGKIDEVHIASVARSADWITTEYNNQSSPSTFMTLGSEIALGGVNGWYFFFP